MTRAALALGGNLGQPREALRAAVAGLDANADVQVRAVSGLWQTAPVGGREQPDYLNAVVLVETSLAAADLLELAFHLEAQAGRQRAERWGPRTLDVDLLVVDDERHDDEILTLPHPRAHLRGFVLLPWAELDPEQVLAPEGQPARTVAEWAASVPDQAAQRIDSSTWWR